VPCADLGALGSVKVAARRVSRQPFQRATTIGRDGRTKVAMVGESPQAQRTDADLLRRVCVRPIQPEERARWDALMDEHHYLGLRALFGKTLRYVASADGQWLALLGWQAAALTCAVRDAWIGWPRVGHYQRLHLLANNARFLILPQVHVANLASRVLGLNLRRLSADWRRVHGHPLLLAETFVDGCGSFVPTRSDWETTG
jgi:hypothetical protein